MIRALPLVIVTIFSLSASLTSAHAEPNLHCSHLISARLSLNTKLAREVQINDLLVVDETMAEGFRNRYPEAEIPVVLKVTVAAHDELGDFAFVAQAVKDPMNLSFESETGPSFTIWINRRKLQTTRVILADKEFFGTTPSPETGPMRRPTHPATHLKQ